VSGQVRYERDGDVGAVVLSAPPLNLFDRELVTVPNAELVEQALALARRLAAGPPLANAATKRVVRAQTDEGTRGADAATADIVAPLFETEDLKQAVRTFLEQGPGKAAFRGR